MQGDEKHKRERFVMSLAYSPDGKLIACGTQIGSVAVFDVESGKLVSMLEGHYKPVRSLTFTPGKVLCLPNALSTFCFAAVISMSR